MSERTNADLSISPERLQPFSLKSGLNAASEHKKPFKIKDCYSGRILFETEAETLKDAVEEAVTLQVNLIDADLRKADLGGAWLAQAELSCADLSGANLFGAILHGAYLTGARLCNADLRYANFRYATLRKAALRNSELICTDFLGSNLTQADFRSSNLEGADLCGANITSTSFDPRLTVPKEGSFEAWKMVFDKQGDPLIAKVLIPEDAKRTMPLFGRMGRAEFVKVLELSRGVSFAKCGFYPDRIYCVDEIVCDRSYYDNIEIGCSIHGGINFYFTREEVERDCRQDRWFPPLVSVTEYWKSSKTYRGWINGAKYVNQPDDKEGKWRAGTLFDAYKAKLMNQWDEEEKS